MSIRPLITVIGAALASLAFASTASAAPSTPIMQPIPKYACGNVTAAWTPSAPDPGGTILGYRLNLFDLTDGSTANFASTTLSAPVPGLVANHKYVVRVRAVQYLNGAIQYSLPSGRAFQKTCLFIDPSKWANEYVEYNPWECWVCNPIEGLRIEDPVIQRAVAAAKLPGPERFAGMQIEADGAISFR